MRAITIIVGMTLLLVPLPLRDADLDYIVVLGFIGAVVAACILTWRLPLSWLDAGWLLALAFAGPQVAFALASDARPIDVAFQSLIFFTPVVALAARLGFREVSDRQLASVCLWLCALKVAAYIPYAADVVRALTTAGERNRFHDLSGIVVCMFLVGCLSAGVLKSWGSKIVVGATAVLLLAAAAHRSLYLAVLVQLALAMFVHGTSRQRRAAILTGLSVLAVTYLTPFGQIILDLASNSLSGYDENTNARVVLSQAVWNAAFEFPFGHGFGGYFMYGVDSDSELVTYALQHNSFLTYLYYLGWIPFAAIILATTLATIYSPTETKSAVVLKGTFVGMSVFACFNMFLESPIYAVLYWLIFGYLTASSAQLLRTQKSASPTVLFQ